MICMVYLTGDPWVDPIGAATKLKPEHILSLHAITYVFGFASNESVLYTLLLLYFLRFRPRVSMNVQSQGQCIYNLSYADLELTFME